MTPSHRGASEHQLTEEKLRAERALREASGEALRREAILKFHEIEALQTAHQLFHEREHLLTDEAIDKAAGALDGRLTALERDLDRWRDSASNFMTVERFDREHSQLIQRVDTALQRLEEKLGAEERVTLRQTTEQQTRDALLAELGTNRRWLLGLAATLGVTLVISVLNWLRLI